jgi:prepilin-type N-terminal cleavage/methylation domain-containing protein
MKYHGSVLSTTRRRRRCESGFTLLETMAVLVIISMLVAIGYPILWRSQVRARLLSEVRMVQQATMVARVNAVKHSRRVALRLLEDNAQQEGGAVVAWVDDNEDGLHTAGEQEVGRWNVKQGYFLGPNGDDPLLKLATSDSGRGVVFLPGGTTIANVSGAIGVGQGAVVISDERLNVIRLMIRGGSGTVTTEMWDPEASDWSDEIRFWRY